VSKLELLQEAVLLSAEKLRINYDLLLNKLNRHSSETRMLTNIMLERPGAVAFLVRVQSVLNEV